MLVDRTLSSSRHVKSSAFTVGCVLLDAYTGCASRFSNVCLFTVATLETIYNQQNPAIQFTMEVEKDGKLQRFSMRNLNNKAPTSA